MPHVIKNVRLFILGETQNRLVETIFKELECQEEQTKIIIGLILEDIKLFDKKQHDYGPGNISVGTQLQTKEEIRLSLMGLFFRMNDKIQRVKTLLMNDRESAVKDEPMEDAYLDVSNYGIMATIVGRKKWGK